MNRELTILTPSYNRAHTLPRLYDSLCRQSENAFDWLLVDDGSTDETVRLAEQWEREARLCMRYLRKENGGKHTALNLGISCISTGLIFIVDSDDWLPENAVELILRYHRKYGGTPGLCGYSFLRFYPDGRVNEAFFPENERIDSYVNVRINGGIGGDKAEVFYTEVLKKFPFPVYEGEKFVPEDLIWMKMSGPYKMVHINECVYISEYLEGGLTKSGKRMKLKSPMAMTERAKIYLNEPSVRGRVRLKMQLLYQIYGKAAGYTVRELRRGAPSGAGFWGCRLPALIIGLLWRCKYGK